MEDPIQTLAPSDRRAFPWIRLLGAFLVAASCVGFFAVADDLDHLGELLAVVAVLVAGLALVCSSFPNPVSRRIALPWLAAGALTGSLVGAAIDHMPVGVAGGLLLGLVVGVLARPRS